MMRIGHRVRQAGSLLSLVVLLTAGGCGYKTDPVPPESIVPLAIDDLRHTIDESGVRLSWSFPVKTVRGSDVLDISTFELYRAVVPLDDVCETCPIPFAEPLELPGGVTTEQGKRRQAEYSTSLLRSGHKYFFKVRSKTSWWADSADSNIVSFVWHIPATAPTGVSADAGDSKISLNWQPVTSLIDGSPATGPISYQVLRSEGGKEFEPVGEPLAATRFVDSRVINGRKYFYKVQSRLLFEGNEVEGGMSQEVSAVSVDKTPPLPPTGVTAVQTDSGIRVFWDRGDEAEVAAYRIYRRTADDRTLAQVGEVQAVYNLFVDNKVPAAERVYYSVTAVDPAGNESDQSREATTR